MKEDIYDRIQELTEGRGADACIDAVGTEPDTRSGFDAVVDRVKVATFMGTDRPHVLRQAIHCCRNFGTVSIVGVYGGFLDKIPMGSAINRGLTFRMAQTPVQHYLPKLLERIEKGEIDPSFVITHRAPLERGPRAVQDVPGQEGRLHQGRAEAVTIMARVLIGTSGWHYDSWRGPFFPKGLPSRTNCHITRASFRRPNSTAYFTEHPRRKRSGAGGTRPARDFIFAWKASKFITHWKRLSANSVNSLELLEDRLSLLGDKAGPVLFQLPPNFKVDADRLASFLKLLPKKRRYSFEFRHPSWYAPQILRLLRAHNIALCISDHHDAPAPWKRTARLCLCARAWPDRPIQRPLSAANPLGMGSPYQVLEEARLRCVRLFRQRPEERRPCRCQNLA